MERGELPSSASASATASSALSTLAAMALPWTTLCQTYKPAGGVDHVARDGGERIAAHATERIPQHLAGARHERQVLQTRHIGIAHDAHVDVAARGFPVWSSSLVASARNS